MTLSILDIQASSFCFFFVIWLATLIKRNVFSCGGRGREPGSKRGVKGGGDRDEGNVIESSQSSGNRREIGGKVCNVT